MSRLYSVSDEEFKIWINSNPNEEELQETLLVLQAKRTALWDASSDDSFLRDRYDRDSDYVVRMRAVKDALSKLWISSGQIQYTNYITG